MNADFVSFDLAKKLKEKGFREKCLAFYTSTKSFYYNNTNVCSDVEDLLECCNESEEYDDIDAPTISQVLKWLREEQAVHISISIYSKGWYCDVYTYEYYEEDREYSAKHIVQLDEFSTYEEAALAGIDYALDDLI